MLFFAFVNYYTANGKDMQVVFFTKKMLKQIKTVSSTFHNRTILLNEQLIGESNPCFRRERAAS